MNGFERAPNTITSRGLAMEAYYKKAPPNVLARFWGGFEPDLEEQSRYALLPLHCSDTHAPNHPFIIILKWLSRDTCVRFWPMTPLDHETYIPCVECGFDGPQSEDEFEHQMIYVREPPPKPANQSNVFSYGNVDDARIVPNSNNTDRYALKNWYLGRFCDASIKASLFDWEISFGIPHGLNEWKLFAVLMFKKVGGPSIIVALTLDGVARTMARVALRVPLQSVGWTDMCEAAEKVSVLWFAGRLGDGDPNKADICWQACGFSKDCGGDQSIRAQDGTVIRLVKPRERQSPFVLAFEPEPIQYTRTNSVPKEQETGFTEASDIDSSAHAS
ncbi:MAG: hypothetical protein LQ346_006653 [Caloplaca aetnensis]|nr:MAG: hypothetical protein LQ346_006653 [Caloplaca aetnensis]